MLRSQEGAVSIACNSLANNACGTLGWEPKTSLLRLRVAGFGSKARFDAPDRSWSLPETRTSVQRQRQYCQNISFRV